MSSKSVALLLPFVAADLRLLDGAVGFGMGFCIDEAREVTEGCFATCLYVPPVLLVELGILLVPALILRDDWLSFDEGFLISGFFSISTVTFRFFVVSSSGCVVH